MATCQEYTRISGYILLFYVVVSSASKYYEPIFQDLPTHVYQRHLKGSRHQPLCILFREHGVGSKLEKILYSLWKNATSSANYSWWEFGSFSPQENNLPPLHTAPSSIPSVRCYLGETSAYDYTGRVIKQTSAYDYTGRVIKHYISNWLDSLERVYQEQNQDVTVELLNSVKKEYDIALLVFPDGPSHHEVEDMVYGLAAEQDSCKALAVHFYSPNILEWISRYDIDKYPSVVIIHTKGETKGKEDSRVFSGHEVKRHTLTTYLMAKSMSAPHLSPDLLERYLYKQNTVEWQFKPVLVLLYAFWAKDSTSHLTAFNIAISQYQESGVNLRYGLIDLQDPKSKIVIQKYLQTGALKNLPCTLLFYKGDKGNITYSVLTSERPYPWVMYEALEALSNGMLDLTGVEEAVVPWAAKIEYKMSELYEGPYGRQCSVVYHNMTDNNPREYKIFVKKKKHIKKPSKKLTRVHDMFSSEKIEQTLALHDGIPLITGKTWSEVIEKSHARGHPFYQTRQWAGEVTKVALVVFIMADCRSCRNANETFQELRKQVSFVEGGTMYMVNCTAEPDLCSKHDIRGFPVVTTFRGLGWAGTSSCISQRAQKMFKNYVRQDYHGVLMVKPIMEWFSSVAASAVMDKKFEPVSDTFEDKDTRLVATLMPRTTRFLPMPPQRKKDYYFCYECLRLICERLFGVIDCYSQYSHEIPAREFEHDDDLEMVVTKIELERRDGAKALIMNFGNYLRETLDSQSDELLHRFHKPHRYKLGPTQKCEDDHASCTDLITDYTLDHCRLPVTPLTSNMFHTSSSLFKDENLPILVAVVFPENITEGSEFMQALTSVAYDLYDKVVVMTLNAKKYSWWASNFVPRNYGRERFLEPENSDPRSMFVYPRLCIIQKHDHRHAAFYPPLSRARYENEELSREIIREFVEEFLTDPEKMLEETEHF